MKFFLMLIGCSFTIQVAFSQDYSKAVNEYLYGDLKKSIQMFEECLAKQENVSECYMYIGAANIFLNNLDTAEALLYKSYEMDSSNKYICFYLGKLHLFKNSFSTSEYYLSKAIQKDSTYASAYVDRANAKVLMGNYDSAIIDYSKAILLNPKDATVYSDRGYAKLSLKQYEQAIKDFEISISIEPTQKAFTNLGLTYSLIDKNELAIEYYSKALQILPNDYGTLYLRGIAYYKIGEQENACTDLTKSADMGCIEAKKKVKDIGCHK